MAYSFYKQEKIEDPYEALARPPAPPSSELSSLFEEPKTKVPPSYKEIPRMDIDTLTRFRGEPEGRPEIITESPIPWIPDRLAVAIHEGYANEPDKMTNMQWLASEENLKKAEKFLAYRDEALDGSLKNALGFIGVNTQIRYQILPILEPPGVVYVIIYSNT